MGGGHRQNQRGRKRNRPYNAKERHSERVPPAQRKLNAHRSRDDGGEGQGVSRLHHDVDKKEKLLGVVKPEEEESEEEEGVSAYQQLISTISSEAAAAHPLSESEDEMSEEEEDGGQSNDAHDAEAGSSDEEDEDADSHMEEEQSGALDDESDEEDEDNDDDAAADQEEMETDEDEDDEEEEMKKDTDPFCIHFERDIDEDVVRQLEKGATAWSKEEIKIPLVGRCQHQFPTKTKPPAINTREKDLHKQHVRPKVCPQVASTNRRLGKVALSSSETFSSLQQKLFAIMNSYKDLYYPERSPASGEEIRLTYCLHAINHVLKTRTRVIDHNSKIKSKKDDIPEWSDRWTELHVYCIRDLKPSTRCCGQVLREHKVLSRYLSAVPGTSEFRDQGLTRPKVLIVVPFRDSALKVVSMMMKLLMPKDQSFVTNKKRFVQEYSAEEAEKHGKKPEDSTGRSVSVQTLAIRRAALSFVRYTMKTPEYPVTFFEDYESIFSGNIDDHFRVGLGIAKKSLKIYTEFYSSDIIVASPLGLRTVIGVEGEEKRDFDFLSSIELLIFDQADIFLMQNWDHISHLMSHLHIQPSESHGVDFSRVRMWTLNGWSKWYRQTLIFSDIVTPEINAIFNKHCQNYAGKVLVPKVYVGSSIQQIVVSLPQVFKRIEVASYSEVADARFKFFKEKVLPDYLDQVMAQTLIVIPSYFDFVRVRNYLKKEELDFVQLSEYSKDASISRSRSSFFHRKTHMMLYTERLHFFRRFVIRGIKHLIFYELPQYSHFYSEICNMLADARRHTQESSATCTVLYTKYDAQRLAAVVGTDRASHMVTPDKSVFMFVTGDDQ